MQAQQTVFQLFRDGVDLGDQYFEQKNYPDALKLYINASRKKSFSSENHLKMARCYYSLKQYKQSINYYSHYLSGKHTLPPADLYNFAEALAVTANYGKAIESYREYLVTNPKDEVVIKKIWRLNNIQYLYEDSAQFSVKPISFNTNLGELCPTYFNHGIVFISNRKETQVVEKVNASLDAPFYKIYYCSASEGSAEDISYNKVLAFDKAFMSHYNAGPVGFYDNDNKMVFVTTSVDPGANGVRTLQLFFGELNNGKWTITKSFPYNSLIYSISDPSISNDGTTLYFSSDMPGGFGGRDLYKSVFIDGRWSKPVNLGEGINTAQDEVFPYLHLNNMLYFSSNGHPGLGGLDIFKARANRSNFEEPQNAGYPINSSYDDFGIVIDSMGEHGYFSSNRKRGGYDDDIYELEMDLQQFPLEISGVIKYKESDWDDSKELQIMRNVKISVIDQDRNEVVHESVSDEDGNFNIVIPYFSKFVIRVIQPGEDNHVVALEIPKRRKELSAYEIVIVKDIFKKE
ncbi:MAG TPA: hypothetical protein VFW11_13670 [Cyclobacteriaceae bacterium]|nr:hypothetical protein [Cyclobacteriaceae bacterium]